VVFSKGRVEAFSPVPWSILYHGYSSRRRNCAGYQEAQLEQVNKFVVAKHQAIANRGHSNDGSSGTAAGDLSPSATSGVDAPTGTGANSPTSTVISKDFPIGVYSFATFLDTVQTDCASNPDTWTCFPYTTFNTDASKALTTFNWVISAGSKSGTYQISSTNNPFAIDFQNSPLTIVDQGQDTERYHFQITMDKVVIPTVALTSDNAASKCFFNSTTFTGYLYTKMAKDYPTSVQTGVDAAYQLWPFGARAEQTVAGGANVPNCYKTIDGNLGERITQNITAENPTTLCSCLYKNWRTPTTA
jgi:hypothetical protein